MKWYLADREGLFEETKVGHVFQCIYDRDKSQVYKARHENMWSLEGGGDGVLPFRLERPGTVNEARQPRHARHRGLGDIFSKAAHKA